MHHIAQIDFENWTFFFSSIAKDFYSSVKGIKHENDGKNRHDNSNFIIKE